MRRQVLGVTYVDERQEPEAFTRKKDTFAKTGYSVIGEVLWI